MRQLLLEINPGVTPSLDNFVVGRNAEVLNSLRDMASGAGMERFIYLWGDAGCGKTHLLRAVTSAYSTGRAIYRLCEPGMGFGGAQGADLLAVDNVQHLTDSGQITLFNVYNEMREGNGMLLVSGDVPPAQLSLRGDLKTRLAWGLVYQLHGLSPAETAAALQRHARDRGMRLTDEVIEYMFNLWQRDLPSLLAVLDKLDRYSLETKKPVSVSLLKQVLKPDDLQS
jgi:DnaA-homolog protein